MTDDKRIVLPRSPQIANVDTYGESSDDLDSVDTLVDAFKDVFLDVDDPLAEPGKGPIL